MATLKYHTGSAWTQVAPSMDEFDTHLGDYVLQVPYGTTGGTANTYTLTLSPAPASYLDGMGIAVKIHAQNTGASTINVNSLGAISIKKPNGGDVSSGNLQLNSVYSMRYNGTNFILQGSDSEGDATTGDVLTTKTFSNDFDTGLTGNMPNRGTVNYTPGTTNQTVASGYHSGSGVVYSLGGDAAAAQVRSGYTFSSNTAGRAVSGTMANRTGHVTAQSSSISGTTLRFRPHAGFYPGDSANSVQRSDDNFVAGNIKNGVSIFGVNGNFKSPSVIYDGGDWPLIGGAQHIIESDAAIYDSSMTVTADYTELDIRRDGSASSVSFGVGFIGGVTHSMLNWDGATFVASMLGITGAEFEIDVVEENGTGCNIGCFFGGIHGRIQPATVGYHTVSLTDTRAGGFGISGIDDGGSGALTFRLYKVTVFFD